MTSCDSPLRRKYLKLLDANHPERRYQRFIEKNTQLVPREFIQNHRIHWNLVFRQFSLGNDYVCDFAYLAGSSVSWNLVLVEIERPGKRFFKGKGRFSGPFNAALNQINDWRTWLDTDANRAQLKEQLSPVLKPLFWNPIRLRYVLVYGRREELGLRRRNRQRLAGSEKKDLRIVTFDGLCEGLELRSKLCLAARTNDFVDLLSDDCVPELMFNWVDPGDIRISRDFARSAQEQLGSGRQRRDVEGKMVSSVKYVLDNAIYRD